MTIYRVGGCVRDRVMGKEPKDIDYVVVGGTEKDMLDMGFQKVGADFPVYLHPDTGEEYALARTERKTGSGYLGFETYFGPEVTLEQDLYRRDFTMNAMAQRDGQIFDPYAGQSDIQHGIIRHVNSEAFIEDPVRILRAARFAARYDFVISNETLNLINKITVSDIKSVPRERVMLELEKALKDGKGYQFLKILSEFSDFTYDLFMGVGFNQRLWAIDEVYQRLGMMGAMCLIAEVDGSIKFLNDNKASSDTVFLYRLVVKFSQRHVFEPQDAFDLIQQSDYYRRPKFLNDLDQYMKATTINIVSMAMMLTNVKAADFPGLEGIQIKHAIAEKRKKLFDEALGL